MKKTTVIVLALGLSMLLTSCIGKSSDPKLINLGDGTCQEKITGRVWRMDKSDTAVTSLEKAKEYIAQLNKTSTDKDWRLPKASEFYELNYLFDLFLNGDCNLDRKGKYWSEEEDGRGMVGAWVIGEQCDPSRQYASSTRGYVRAVRP